MAEYKHTRNEEGFIRIDESLIKHLFFAYRAGLIKWATSIIGDGKEADDIVQNKFFDLWQYRDTLRFKEERAIRAWLYTGVRNSSVDHLRKAKYERKLKNRLSAEEEFEEPKELDMLKIRICAMDYLEQAIERLPPRIKMVVALYLEGQTSIEIGQEMGIVDGAVRGYLKRAREILKKEFDENRVVLILVMILFGTLAGQLIEYARH